MSDSQKDVKKSEWSTVKSYKHDKTGIQVRVQKDDRPAPAFSIAVGFTHKQRQDYTPFSRFIMPYHKPELADVKILDDLIEGLLAMKDQINSETAAHAKELEANVPVPQPRKEHHHNQHRKPGEPGKTGKTARKKAKLQAARQPNGTNGTPAPAAS